MTDKINAFKQQCINICDERINMLTETIDDIYFFGDKQEVAAHRTEAHVIRDLINSLEVEAK